MSCSAARHTSSLSKLHAIHDSRESESDDDMQRWITSLRLRGGFTSAPSCARYSTPPTVAPPLLCCTCSTRLAVMEATASIAA
jgi:hypothetical protein